MRIQVAIKHSSLTDKAREKLSQFLLSFKLTQQPQQMTQGINCAQTGYMYGTFSGFSVVSATPNGGKYDTSKT